jgi:hypothetical protein
VIGFAGAARGDAGCVRRAACGVRRAACGVRRAAWARRSPDRASLGLLSGLQPAGPSWPRLFQWQAPHCRDLGERGHMRPRIAQALGFCQAYLLTRPRAISAPSFSSRAPADLVSAVTPQSMVDRRSSHSRSECGVTPRAASLGATPALVGRAASSTSASQSSLCLRKMATKRSAARLPRDGPPLLPNWRTLLVLNEPMKQNARVRSRRLALPHARPALDARRLGAVVELGCLISTLTTPPCSAQRTPFRRFPQESTASLPQLVPRLVLPSVDS